LAERGGQGRRELSEVTGPHIQKTDCGGNGWPIAGEFPRAGADDSLVALSSRSSATDRPDLRPRRDQNVMDRCRHPQVWSLDFDLDIGGVRRGACVPMAVAIGAT